MAGRWLLRVPPAGPEPLLLGFPYAGGGAALYREWPAMVGGARFGALGPPGREYRISEPPLRTHAEFTASLLPFLAQFSDRPLAFFGHCGGVPLALSTALALVDAGLPAPVRIFASAWGPPHLDLYGPLNHVDLPTADLNAEVEQLFRSAGVEVREDFVQIAARVLRVDLELHRPHRYDAARRVPAPVTVIGWTGDEVVPAGQVVAPQWQDCAEVDFHIMDGEHFAFARCPVALRTLIGESLANG